MNVLLVDVHTLFCSAIKILLEKQDDIYVVDHLTCTEDVLHFLQTRDVDIIMMEVNLSFMEDFELVRYIKEKYPKVKVVILTMYDNEQCLFKALRAGVNGYILKETSENELIWAIRFISKGGLFISPSRLQVLTEKILPKKERRTKKEKKNTLTGREKEVLSYVALGYTHQEIAEKLFIAVGTIEKHKDNIRKKLNLRQNHELIEYAIKEGLFARGYLREIESGSFRQ